MKAYPAGKIGQHKSLATGQKPNNTPSGKSGKTGFEGSGSKEGGIHKSTGSRKSSGY